MSDPQNHSTFEAPDPAQLAPLFPGYDISGLIACGGMGAVYHAVQRSLDRAVAIKILPREFSADAAFCAGFEAEAKAMARLNHPNLIGVYDFGEVDGMLFIIMEFVPGQSLYHSAHGTAIDPAEVVRLVSGVCHGLAHAHQNGIIHRDIKPANILLDLNAQPKIGDFGLARPLDRKVEEGEEIFGTPHYTAPEVVNSPQSVDSRADIFSLGVLLHELLTGRLPADDPRPPSVISRCNPRFDAIVRRATHPTPEMRYTNAEEMAADLAKIPTSAGARMLQTTAPAGGHRAAPRTYQPVKKSSNSPAIILILLAAIGGAAFLLYKKTSVPEQGTPPPVTSTEKPVEVPIEVPSPEPDIAPPPPDIVEVDDDPEPDEDISPVTIDGVLHWQNATSRWNPQADGTTEFSVSSGDIWRTADSGAFRHEPWTGDGIFTLKVGNLQSPHQLAQSGHIWAKAGLMIRQTLDDDSRNVFLLRSVSGRTALQHRAADGGNSVSENQISRKFDHLRIIRRGDLLTAQTSENGSDWTEIGTVTLPNLPEKIHVGFASSSSRPDATITGWVSALETQAMVKPNFDVDGFYERAHAVMRDRIKNDLEESEKSLAANIKSFERDIKRIIRRVHTSRREMYEESLAEAVSEWSETNRIADELPRLLTRLRSSEEIFDEHLAKQAAIDEKLREAIDTQIPTYILGLERQIERLAAENDPGAVRLLEEEIERTKTHKTHFRDLLIRKNG